MGRKHKRFREFRTPIPLRNNCENPRSNSRACAASDGTICSKNRKIVPYHGDNPNTRNGAHLRSPSPIMAPGEKIMMEIIGAFTELFGSHRRYSEIFESIQVIFEKLRKSSDDLCES